MVLPHEAHSGQKLYFLHENKIHEKEWAAIQYSLKEIKNQRFIWQEPNPPEIYETAFMFVFSKNKAVYIPLHQVFLTETAARLYWKM